MCCGVRCWKGPSPEDAYQFVSRTLGWMLAGLDDADRFIRPKMMPAAR
jgi:hypothetical protein